MPADDKALASIAGNLALARKEFADLTDQPFGLDRPTVAWLEGYVERMRKRDPNLAGGGLASVIGSVLGEAIIAAVPGATWERAETGGVGVRLPSGDTCFPFAKVDKQFHGGREDGESILSFYDIAVTYVAKGRLNAPATPPVVPPSWLGRLRRALGYGRTS